MCIKLTNKVTKMLRNKDKVNKFVTIVGLT